MTDESVPNEKVLEILVNFSDAIEAAAVDLKHRAAELMGVKETVAVKEEAFTILKWQKRQGAKIGDYETAHRRDCLPEQFNPAFNILSKSSATIASRYHGEGYIYVYWLYGSGKIYRQRRKSY